MTTVEHELTPPQVYAQYFVPAIFEPLADAVVELAAPAPGERVLDLACGTGVVARRISALVGPTGAVVGVDLNPGMLALAAVASGAVEWRQGDAAALDLPGESFDLVVCQQGLQFVPDQAAAAAEMRRVVLPGGRAVVAVWHGLDQHPLFAALAEAERPYLDQLGASPDDVGVPFSFGDEQRLRDLLASAGFRDVEVVQRSIEARFTSPERFIERMEMAYAAVVPKLAQDAAAFRTFVNVVSEAARPVVERYRRDSVLVVPMHANVALARA